MEKSFITRLRNIFLYIALTIELLLMIYERSVFPLSSPKPVFRVSFIFTVLALLLTHYSVKQWIVIVITGVISVIGYRVTGNNDLLRFSLFVIACKDADLKKMLKYIFAVTVAGALIIVAGSVFGIAGDVKLIGDFGRGADEVRYAFGFGHPNTLQSVIFSITVLFIYLIKDFEKFKRNVIMLAALVFNVIIYFLTYSRTGTALTVFTIMIAFLVYGIEPLKRSKLLYISGVVVIAGCVGFSVWAAAISRYARKKKYPFYYKLDRLLTGRIQSLYYDTKPHKGSLQTWSLWGDEFSGNAFFDMGWVRLFYWYGIIPAILILIVIVYLIFKLYQRRDYGVMIMIISVSLFTLVEASFVSSFIGRNYLLPIAGVYLLSDRWEENSARKSKVSN
ncbi:MULTISPECIES: hypothetical protein [unclassified Butyrivibrio]|uniref:hypothetical protein n=1 Tax=unclassified Butyrivibrio TaxID=2639466 RepID=UPI0004143C41|nr:MULTISPECIES: hypothetical protein [unclassified Butyrivibrio]